MKRTKKNALVSEQVKYVIKRSPVSIGIGILVAAIFILYFSGYAFKNRSHSQHGESFAISVEARNVEVMPHEDKVVTVGSVKANESVIIRSELPGKVREIHFLEGKAVKQGDVLVILNDEVHQAELNEAEANLKLSEANYQRVDKLYKEKYKSSQQADLSLAEYKRDIALVDRHKAIFKKTRLIAPFDGIIGLRLVSPGDYITVGEDIVNLESISPVKIDFRLPEIYVTSVKTGQEILIKADALPDREFKGKVYAIAPLLDVNGRSLALRGEVQNKDGALLPGMFVIVTIVLNRYQNAILVPEEALVPKGKEQFVYRVVNNTAKLTKVKVGHRTTGKAHIVAGLSPKDVVITAGQLKIQDGTAVKVLKVKG